MSPVDTSDGANFADVPNWRVARLQRAQEDTYRLLAYATEQGRALSPEILKDSVDIARAKPESMTEEQEEILWRIRSMLSGIVQPAQPSGLRLLEVLESETATGEPKTLRGWSGKWLAAAVVVVASIHMYTLLGGRLVDDGATKLVQAGSLSQRLKSQTLPPTMDPGAVGGSLAPTPVSSAAVPTANFAPDGSPMVAEPPLTVGEAAGMTNNVRTVLDRQRKLLENWNDVWRALLFPIRIARAQASVPEPPRASDVGVLPDESPSQKPMAWMHDLAQDLDRSAVIPLDGERYTADLARRVLMEYLLPMLYGALGAFVFVVRLVTSDIDRGSIRMLLNIRYRIRLLLGAIFGLTVAMLTSEKAPFMNSIPLSAVALSFLAGYGVEAAFGILDMVIERIREMGSTLTRRTDP